MTILFRPIPMPSGSKPNSGRLSRYRAGKIKSDSLIFQDGDATLLTNLADYRYLTTEMLTTLTGRSVKALQRRLRKLFDGGYLGRIPFKSGKVGYPSTVIHVLKPKGALKASEISGRKVIATPLKNENREYQLAHHLLVSHFHVILEVACKAHPTVSLLGWKEGREIYRTVTNQEDGVEVRYPVAPDGFFGLQDSSRPEGQQRSYFFFEADRSTMSHATFQKKLKGYLALWKSKKQESLYKIKGFRVLTITEEPLDWQAKRGLDRQSGLLQDVREVDTKGSNRALFYFTTKAQLAFSDPAAILTKVWQMAEPGGGIGVKSIITSQAVGSP